MLVTVFGGNNCAEEVRAMAEELGKLLAEAGHTVITGGYAGVMSAVSKGAREAGGSAIGVVLRGIGESNMFVSAPVLADNYWDRLGTLMEMGDAYVFLSGGSGTSTELLAALHTQTNRKKLMPNTPAKKVILLCAHEGSTYRMLAWLEAAAGKAVADELVFADAPHLVLKYLAAPSVKVE